MRSIYQPSVSSIPLPLTSIEPLPWVLGGECGGSRTAPPGARDNAVDRLLAPLVAQVRRIRRAPALFAGGRVSSRKLPLPAAALRLSGSARRRKRDLSRSVRGDPRGRTRRGHGVAGFPARTHGRPGAGARLRDLCLPGLHPSGLEDRTRGSRAGYDLNREFWQGSRQPEVYYLERELGVHQFAGLVSLHSDDTVEGVRAFVRGATLTEALAKPALAAAARFLPLASGGTGVSPCHEGVLGNLSELTPPPFEIVLETPQRAPVTRQVDATKAALGAILSEYREFIAYGQDL